MDISKVTNPDARRFLTAFFNNRQITRDFFNLVPENKFDYRMVDTLTKKSDTPRESLAHLIRVTRAYILGIQNGFFKAGAYKNESLANLSKTELLKELEIADQELIEVLSIEENVFKKVVTPWNPNSRAVDMLWGLDSHEILHTGWNIALMDHLGIDRFESLKKMWG